MCSFVYIIIYILLLPFQPNFSSIIEHCNLWRNFDDIQDSWASVESIIDYYGNHQDVIVPNAGPGHWNDPDMVIIFVYLYKQKINNTILVIDFTDIL